MCRARDELEEERVARIDAEDIVSKLQEQLAEVQSAEVTARQDAETRLSSLTQEYESIKNKVRSSGIPYASTMLSLTVCMHLAAGSFGQRSLPRYFL